MFNRAAFENTRSRGFGVLELVDGDDPARPRRFVPLQHTALTGEVIGPLATLRLTQVFRYTRAQADAVLEAVYRFPVPGDAAVTGLHVRFGAVEICAELQARAEAETAYAEARQEGLWWLLRPSGLVPAGSGV